MGIYASDIKSTACARSNWGLLLIKSQTQKQLPWFSVDQTDKEHVVKGCWRDILPEIHFNCHLDQSLIISVLDDQSLVTTVPKDQSKITTVLDDRTLIPISLRTSNYFTIFHKDQSLTTTVCPLYSYSFVAFFMQHALICKWSQWFYEFAN